MIDENRIRDKYSELFTQMRRVRPMLMALGAAASVSWAPQPRGVTFDEERADVLVDAADARLTELLYSIEMGCDEENIFVGSSSVRSVVGVFAGACSVCWDRAPRGTFAPEMLYVVTDCFLQRLEELYTEVVGADEAGRMVWA